jgi:hypothetical protein
MNLRSPLVSVIAAVVSVVVFMAVMASPAAAADGNYVFAGGTANEQTQVRQALDASSFDWNLVPTQVTIHIVKGLPASYSTPGQTWLDANLLDSGQFSWGTVQMEYAQQVQFTTLNQQQRTALTSQLGAQQWCYDNPALPRGDNACERFAATLAWAYWPSSQNSMKPAGASDWSASMNPKAFRTLLSQLIGAPDTIDATAALDASHLARAAKTSAAKAAAAAAKAAGAAAKSSSN